MRAKTLYISIVLAMLLLTLYPVVYGVFYQGEQKNNPFACPPLIPCAKSPPAQTTCSQLCIIYMENSSFSPATLNVTKGAIIEWVNMDSIPHTTTSLLSTGWSSPFISPGGKYELNTSTLSIGTYYYRCTIHFQMVGQINLLPSNNTSPSR